MDLLTSNLHSDFADNDQFPENAEISKKYTLPEDLIDFQCSLAGRESFSTEGRDSLGILQNFVDNVPKFTLESVEEVSFVQMDIDGRESLGILTNSFVGDGRESLGLLGNVFFEDTRNSLLRNCLDIASLSSNLLNVGFMKLSTTSSISSTTSVFRPWSLGSESEELSKIFSITSKENTNSLNTAFVDSAKDDDNLKNSGETEENLYTCVNEKFGEFKFENEDMNDTVFMESRIVAAEIENGSILNELPDDLFSTDSPELVDLLYDEIDEMPSKINTETILKNVDKFFPQEKSLNLDDSKNEETIAASTNDINSINCPVELATSYEHLQEINKTEYLPENNHFIVSNCEISTENKFLKVQQSTNKLNTTISPKFSNSRSRNSSYSRSRDAKDLLNNLSTIISTENMENQSEVKKILQDLADVLLVSNKELNDDSGHSSIEENSMEDVVFDSSQTLEKTEKRLCRSLYVVNSAKPGKNDGIVAETTVNNIKKTRQRSLEDLDGLKKTNVKKLTMPIVKLIPKNNVTVKKGPMKAVVPLANMKRRSSVQSKKVDTPIKNSSFEKSSYMKKRTSTPKMWNTAPVAQSTPEDLNNTEVPSKLQKSLRYSGGNIPSHMSPHSSKSSLNNSSKRSDLLNRSSSASAPNISRVESPSQIPTIATLIASPSKSHLISRRRSLSEIKYTSTNTKPAINNNNLSNKIAKSPLARFSTGGNATRVGKGDNENAYSENRNRYSPVSSAADKDRINSGSNKTDSKTGGSMRSYLSDRNRNLMQYVKPLNLLDKMKK